MFENMKENNLKLSNCVLGKKKENKNLTLKILTFPFKIINHCQK